MLRCAVIGLGNAGKKHLKVYQDHPECEVVQAASEGFDWDIPMDLVSICTPDDWHMRNITAAVKYDIRNVFVEKPLCLKAENLVAAKLAVSKLGLRLSMNMVMRARVPKTEGAYRIDAAYNWGRKEKLSGWRGNLPYHPILGGGIHLIDLMVRDLGIPKDVKSFHSGLTSSTLLSFEKGLGTLVSDLNSPPPHSHRYDVWREPQHVDLHANDITSLNPREMGEFRGDDSLVQTSFINSILHGTPAMVTEEDVFNTMKVCFDAIQ